MKSLKIKIKKLHPEAIVPTYAKSGDAGLDLVCIGKEEITRTPGGHKVTTLNTGLAIEIPEGYVGLLFPRSSVSKKDVRLTNSVGVIDSGYRGEIKAKFDILPGSRPQKDSTYQVGERCIQLLILPYPQIELEEVEELSNTERSSGGFGSSGL